MWVTKKNPPNLAPFAPFHCFPFQVNGIGPSFVETDFTAGLRANDAIYNDLMSRNPLGRFAKPEEKV